MKKQNVRTLSFIVSTLTYLLVGAAIFDALESHTEDGLRVHLEQEEKRYKEIYNITDEEFMELEKIINKFNIYKTYPQWKFVGAFYFSLTVVTTIGYGHSTPQTVTGKVFCMIYAIIGIPLCLVMFQAIGERLNDFTSYCVQFVKKSIRLRNIQVGQTELVCVGGALAVLVITCGAALFTHYEGWSYFDSIYYCVITLTTIGFGDYVALQGVKGSSSNLNNTWYVILSLTFILFGLTVVASSFNLLVLKFLTMNTDDENREEYTREAQRNHSLRHSNPDIANGNVICTFKPADLEDLRRENSFSFVRNNETSIEFQETEQENNFPSLYDNCSNDKENYDNKNNLSPTNSCWNIPKNNICVNQTDLNGDSVKKKRKHYTIRRSPGMISHLLPLERLDSIIAHAKLKENNINLKSHVVIKETNLNLRALDVIEPLENSKNDVELNSSKFEIADNYDDYYKNITYV